MPHTNFKSELVKTFALIALGLTAFSFESKAGGDRFEIYLNDRLITQKYVAHSAVDVSSLQLDKTNYKDRLVIYYSHCGATGKGRSIVIKDDQDKVLREWKFTDATGTDVSMSIPVRDILDLQKNNTNTSLSLYYFSTQYLPKGQMLTSIKVKEKNVAQRRHEDHKNTPAITAGFAGLASSVFMFARL